MNNGATGTGANGATGSTTANANMSSTGNYSAYSGTAVANLPANIQSHFGQDYPAGVNNQYTWNQYGDWFHTYYMGNGRLTQYFYDQRGNGYSLVLPVLETYVPENIVTSALQKYGSSLYSIAMVKTNSGNNAYQIGLLQRGQMSMQYLDDNGATVADVWRVETDSMSSTQSNAAMGTMNNGSNMNNGSSMSNGSSISNGSSGTSTDNSATSNSSTSGSTDMNSSSSATGSGSDMNNAGSGKTKLKIKNPDGSVEKIKTKNGQTKDKSKPTTSGTDMNNQQ